MKHSGTAKGREATRHVVEVRRAPPSQTWDTTHGGRFAVFLDGELYEGGFFRRASAEEAASDLATEVEGELL